MQFKLFCNGLDGAAGVNIQTPFVTSSAACVCAVVAAHLICDALQCKRRLSAALAKE